MQKMHCRDPSTDVESLRSRGANFLVGTPGRLDDILQRCSFLDLKTTEILILDEADRLLDMGFAKQINSIMGRLPRQRRTGLFSATQTEAVESLSRAGLRNPVRVSVAVTGAGQNSNSAIQQEEQQQATPESLHIMYRLVPTSRKLDELINFLQIHSEEKVIVYFLTCACVDFFALILPRLMKLKPLAGHKWSGMHALHGRMKQSVREATLSAFSSAPVGFLLATDVAARGLDIPDVHWVVQYDAPQDPAAFVHRCGRTARMGRSGSALAFLTPEELPYVEFQRFRRVPLTQDQDVTDAKPMADVLRKESESDRAVMEAGIKAFVSYIRAYKEHYCKYIFQFDNLQIGDLAASFALLRLPKMRELKKAMRSLKLEGKLQGFTPSSIDPNDVAFRDKAREKQRQANASERQAASKREPSDTNGRVPSSGALHSQQNAVQPRLTAAKRRTLEARQEVEELNDDYALLKKLKKGKISQREYELATGEVLETDGPNEIQSVRGDAKGMMGKHTLDLVAKAVQKKAKKKKKKNCRHHRKADQV